MDAAQLGTHMSNYPGLHKARACIKVLTPCKQQRGITLYPIHCGLASCGKLVRVPQYLVQPMVRNNMRVQEIGGICQ